MSEGRTELDNLADGDKHRVAEMSKLHQEWAERCGVVPWPANPSGKTYPTRGKHDYIA